MRTLAAFALVACSSVHAVPITVGPSSELLVPVVVDHHALVFQLDTGASTTAITPAARKKLGLAIDDRFVAGAGATGALPHVERTRLGVTTIGSVSIGSLPAAVMELDSAADGVLGMNALAIFTVEVDLARDRLTLYRGQSSWRTPDLVGVPYTQLANGQIVVPIEIDGRSATALLDLGANETYANELAAPRRDQSRVVNATIGADHHPWRFRGVDDVHVRVGGVSATVPVLVSDMPIFRELGLATRPAVILGTDVLAGRRIVIAPHDHDVYFSAASSAGP
ncbi:MAG TPA: aspartyl protease family protein [Kofleriaceae bacterium]|jgi:predicted aspartyl protease